MPDESLIDYSLLEVHPADGTVYFFKTDPNAYIERDITDFAPRAGGGDISYSNLDLYQIITQDSWHHGIGFVDFRDKFGHRITGDSVDARSVNLVQMFTNNVIDYASVTTLRGGVDFNNATYFNCGTAGVWKRTTGGTWTKVLTANVADLISNGTYLMAAVVSGQMKTSVDGTTWTNAGVAGNPPSNFARLTINGGFMWGAEVSSQTKTLAGSLLSVIKMGSSPWVVAYGDIIRVQGVDTHWAAELKTGDIVLIGSGITPVRALVIGGIQAQLPPPTDTVMTLSIQVGGTITTGDTLGLFLGNYSVAHFWSADDSSDAEGGGLKDIFAVPIGAGGYGVRNMTSFNGQVYIARDDGVWLIDENGTSPQAHRVLNFTNEADSSSFSIFTVWNGRLYFNVKNTLYAYSGASLANVTPPTYDLNFPPSGFGGFVSMTTRGQLAYILCRTNAAYSQSVLMAFDGTGWFQLLELMPSDRTDSFSFSIGASVPMTGTLSNTPIIPRSLSFTWREVGPGLDVTLALNDDGNGNLKYQSTIVGTINYTSGAFSILGVTTDRTNQMTFTYASGVDVFTGMTYSALTNNLFLGSAIGVQSVQFQALTELPYPYFATTGHHYLNMSEIDYGLRRVIKSVAEIDLEVYNHATGRYVSVDYSTDGGSWQHLAQTTVDGVNKMLFDPTVEFYKLDVRLDLQTQDSAQSPMLRNVTIKSMVRPDTLYGRQFTVIGSDMNVMRDGRQLITSAAQQRDQLRACRNSKAPMTFITPFGDVIVGYLSTCVFRDIERRPDQPHSEFKAILNVVQTR